MPRENMDDDDEEGEEGDEKVRARRAPTLVLQAAADTRIT